MNSVDLFDSTVLFGWLSSNLLLAVPISVAGAYYVSRRFRRAVAKSMFAAAKGRVRDECEPIPAGSVIAPGSAHLRIVTVNSKQMPSDGLPPSQQLGRANQWRLLTVYVFAGLLYVLVATGLYLASLGGGFALAKILVVAVMFSPPLTAAVMIVGNFGYRLLCFALVIHLFVLEGLWRFFGAGPWSDPFDVILVPTLALLMLSNRRLRAVGPMMYWGVAAVLSITSLGFVYAGVHMVNVLDLHFVDPQLVCLPLPLAAQR